MFLLTTQSLFHPSAATTGDCFSSRLSVAPHSHADEERIPVSLPLHTTPMAQLITTTRFDLGLFYFLNPIIAVIIGLKALVARFTS